MQRWMYGNDGHIMPPFKSVSSNLEKSKEIQIILRLFLVIAMYCLGSSSQIKSITQAAGWEESLGTCSR